MKLFLEKKNRLMWEPPSVGFSAFTGDIIVCALTCFCSRVMCFLHYFAILNFIWYTQNNRSKTFGFTQNIWFYISLTSAEY